MAPTDIANDLTKRQWGYSSYGCGYNNYDDNCNSAWADWGRWVRPPPWTPPPSTSN